MSFFSKDSKKGISYINQKYGVESKPVDSLSSCEGLYSVYDIVCGEYNPPFVCKNMATAVRNMRDSLKDAKQSIIAMHPEDYKLVEIALFNKETGEVTNISENMLSYDLYNLFTSVKEEIKKDVEIPNK